MQEIKLFAYMEHAECMKIQLNGQMRYIYKPPTHQVLGTI
jgi:hypothetical protein